MFDRVIVVDWSAANLPTSLTNRANAVWIGCHDCEGGAEWHHRTRASAEAQLVTLIDTARASSQRVLIGCDFAMGYPAGFAARLTGEARAQAVWRWLAEAITDIDNRNNRFEVATRINTLFPEGPGPFWSHPSGQSWPGLPFRRVGIDYGALGLSETRAAEAAVPRAKSPWMLFNPGSVGSQSLLGLPMIHRLSQLAGVAVWPFAPPHAPVVLAEVYPSLLAGPVAILANGEGLTADQAQVRLLSRALYRLARADRLAPLFDAPPEAAEEGWILGAHHAPLLAEALTWP
ncbi:MAG: molybdopterin guanine dinucleotide synthesis [Tabrizicola sp.]|uniref:molybdopterin guanine dinucleotide synthesis n=1 Tax=Tabrizicola sp. TaxID=2005166 RepID=UPI002AB9400B|nr:molybdopterin guanine dinucleotide synthesis [Tabrizicola sp.]MDZ4085544.1 molybdopterin guanine dinucleotide synthesis [Tabrizicola sp.]